MNKPKLAAAVSVVAVSAAWWLHGPQTAVGVALWSAVVAGMYLASHSCRHDEQKPAEKPDEPPFNLREVDMTPDVIVPAGFLDDLGRAPQRRAADVPSLRDEDIHAWMDGGTA